MHPLARTPGILGAATAPATPPTSLPASPAQARSKRGPRHSCPLRSPLGRGPSRIRVQAIVNLLPALWRFPLLASRARTPSSAAQRDQAAASSTRSRPAGTGAGMAARVRTSPARRGVGSGRRARTGHVGVRSGGRGHARGGGPVALGSGHRRNRARRPRARLARGHLSLPPAARASHSFKGAPGARAGSGGVFPWAARQRACLQLLPGS